MEPMPWWRSFFATLLAPTAWSGNRIHYWVIATVDNDVVVKQDHLSLYGAERARRRMQQFADAHTVAEFRAEYDDR